MLKWVSVFFIGVDERAAANGAQTQKGRSPPGRGAAFLLLQEN
jgi:hypothetical protein